MSQRLAPAPFACPGCKENFDFGIHSPYIGSCAHSLCSACVIEKKTTTCPVCQNPGGFLWKQTNVLATDLLTILAEKRARRLEMEENADNLIGVLFEPDNKNILTAIVNKLAPKDFVHLAMTCRKMKNFCFEEKGIRVNYDYLFVKADLRDPTFPYFGVSKVSNVPSDGSLNDDDLYPQHYTGIGGGFFDHSRNRKKLRQVPFVYKLDTLEIEGVLTSAGMVAIRSFLSEFPIEYVDEIHTNGITDWDGFTLFLKEFKPRIVEIYTEDEGDSSVPNMTAQYILQNTRKFTCDLSISEGLILCAPQNLIFDVRNASVSKDIFEGLVLKCSVSTGYINWLFGCQTCQFDKYKYFREVLPFDHKGPISKERPLAFVKENEPFHFFILRCDDKMIHCVKAVEGPACCVMLHPLEYPPCLQSNSQNAA